MDDPEVIISGNFDPSKMYARPEIVDMFVGSYNTRNPGHPLSDHDRKILRGDPRLAEAVFGERGLVNLIQQRATTVRELRGKPPELLEFLRHDLTAKLVIDNVISVEQLARLGPNKIKSAAQALENGNTADAATALNLSADQTHAYYNSIERTMERYRQQNRSTPELVPDLPPRITPIPNVPLVPRPDKGPGLI